MRVGVHSGELFAGVLGTAKLQYDVWGIDVLIANRLESTGTAGQIHVSERTLQMTDDKYKAYPGTEKARKDTFLQKCQIATFLIGVEETTKRDLSGHVSVNSGYFINDTIDKGLSLEEELKKMPLGPDGLKEFICKVFNFKNTGPTSSAASSEIGSFLLQFHDPRLDYNYIHQADYMLKYSVLLAWCCEMSLIYVQLMDSLHMNSISFSVVVILIFTSSALLIITWCKKICYWRYSSLSHTYSAVTYFLFKLADGIQHSLIQRIVIYVYFIVSYFCIIAIILNNCDEDEFQLLQIDSIVYKYDPDNKLCFSPWSLTCMVCLIIMMSIIFTRIPFGMKILVGFLETVSYLSIMIYQYEYVVHNSLTTNPYLISEYAHCLLIVITLCIIFFKERLIEFNNKINYKWRVELIKKQNDYRIAAQSITILLHNILPAHVVNVYLTSLAKHEFYYENYDMVAVMFASLKNFEMTLPNLRVLNEIISEFDQILYYYRDNYRVEKIKIVGSTYMAACGLDVHTELSIKNESDSHNSLIQEVQRARILQASYLKRNYSIIDEKEEVVFVLTTFALDLMRTLWVCNNDYKNIPIDRAVFNADMSIGISSGEVMAGVVGASQVQYDIWGHAANMASRMDSTGVAGKIQVTQNTAFILKKYGVECNYRGMTFVKGQGILPTYFVDIDSNFEFRYKQDSF
ncbi:adenylyl cyclase X E-like isoform X2 [Drosophila hydei]|nr:adenylyl cyclase X E-like isoform X2 [Drosophila hydei]